MRNLLLVVFGLAACITCSGCATTDQFSSRIHDANLNSQSALDQETLLNIARSSYFAPLTFVAITQVTGGQSETLSTGLPTVSFGPGQTPANHVYQISNALSSGVTGGYQSNPLLSSAFQQGMLSPISLRTMAMLAAAHPRESVFYAVVDGIKLTSSKTTYYFHNDPGNNSYSSLNDSQVCRALETTSGHEAIHAAEAAKLKPNLIKDCNFSEFTYLLNLGFALGLTVELVATPPAKSTNATNVPASVGHWCFDPSLADQEFRNDALQLEPKCGMGAVKKEDIAYGFKFGDVKVDFQLRSPLGIYLYLGKLLREGTARNIELRDSAGISGRPFFEVATNRPPACEIATYFDDVEYCVPKGAYGTMVLIGVLEDLRNLSVTPSDLNSAFSVRLTN